MIDDAFGGFGVHLHHEYLAPPSFDEAFELEAVTSKWFGNALLGQYSATAARRVDWVTDTIKISLHTVTYTPDQDAHDFYNDVTNEVSSSGYTAGGATLASKTTAYDTASNETRLDAADPSWTAVTFTTRYAIIYSDTAGAATTDPVLTYIDFGADQTIASGNFSIQFDATGAAKITAA